MLLPFFEWCEASFIGQAIRNSLWLFPVIESVHLLGLAVIGGAVLIVDMRLLGLGLRQPTREIARDARPWLIGSLIVMLATGISLFLSESIKCYYSQAFWWKMTALPLAIIFTFTVKQHVVRKEDHEIGPIAGKLVALVSLALWFTVGAGGRWIGFS
jgi:Family of unknown function (DUF6644)